MAGHGRRGAVIRYMDQHGVDAVIRYMAQHRRNQLASTQDFNVRKLSSQRGLQQAIA